MHQEAGMLLALVSATCCAYCRCLMLERHSGCLHTTIVCAIHTFQRYRIRYTSKQQTLSLMSSARDAVCKRAGTSADPSERSLQRGQGVVIRVVVCCAAVVESRRRIWTPAAAAAAVG